MLENITFIDRAEKQYAEMICETDAMPCRTYFMVTDLAHEYEAPGEYFSYASAVKCAE